MNLNLCRKFCRGNCCLQKRFGMRMDTSKNVIRRLSSIKGKDVRIVISDNNWLETEAVDQLKTTTDLKGICCGIGMPDLHPGKGQPIGAAFISQNIIYPHLVGSDIGCGMGVWKLNIKPKKINVNKWDKSLYGLDDELSNEEIFNLDSLLPKNIAMTNFDRKLGTIGGGNHFSEIQQVEEVFNERLLGSLKLNKNSIVLLVHSGSRGIGQNILRNHIDQQGAIGLDTKSKEAKEYLNKHDYANEWGVVNRNIIAHRFFQKLNVSGDLLLDVSHNHVQPLSRECAESLGYSGDDYWIHRKGASPTASSLVMIPGSRGSLSYLVKPINDVRKTSASGFSLAHGAGRKWKRSDAKGRLVSRYDHKSVLQTPFSSRVICAHKDLAFEEAQQAYKNIDLVIRDLQLAGVIEVIASFKPLLTYKTRKKS